MESISEDEDGSKNQVQNWINGEMEKVKFVLVGINGRDTTSF